jgi:hypothetical protein
MSRSRLGLGAECLGLGLGLEGLMHIPAKHQLDKMINTKVVSLPNERFIASPLSISVYLKNIKPTDNT